MRGWMLALFVLGSACSSDPQPKATCEDHVTPAGFDPLSPTVQLRRDVMPVFKQSCGFSTCHGQPNNPNGVYLGSDAAAVHASLVDQASPELPSMRLVAPGDATKSYVMHKMDGTQCRFDAQCTGGSCKDPMPKGEVVLDAAPRDVVRRWIAQGAKND